MIDRCQGSGGGESLAAGAQRTHTAACAQRVDRACELKQACRRVNRAEALDWRWGGRGRCQPRDEWGALMNGRHLSAPDQKARQSAREDERSTTSGHSPPDATLHRRGVARQDGAKALRTVGHVSIRQRVGLDRPRQRVGLMLDASDARLTISSLEAAQQCRWAAPGQPDQHQ